MTKKKTFTRISASLLLLPVFHAVLWGIFMGLSCLLEFPCNRSGIYTVVSIIDIFLLMLFPFTSLMSCHASISLGIVALFRKESKVVNILVISLCAILIVATIWFSVLFWQGAMGV